MPPSGLLGDFNKMAVGGAPGPGLVWHIKPFSDVTRRASLLEYPTTSGHGTKYIPESQTSGTSKRQVEHFGCKIYGNASRSRKQEKYCFHAIIF